MLPERGGAERSEAEGLRTIRTLSCNDRVPNTEKIYRPYMDFLEVV